MRKATGFAALLAVLISTFFVVRAYWHENQTYDESAHIACGMQWLSRGTYTYETLHPPFARAATALLPYLDGARTVGKPLMLEEGNALLNRDGAYSKNLTLSRLGVLPFFWLACFLVFRFMALHFSPGHGLIAVILLAFCPPVLAHSALATTDAPLMTMFTWSLLRFWAFLKKPSQRNAVLGGIVLSLAILTKFTELPFFLLAAFLLLLYLAVRERRFPVPVRRLVLLAVLVLPCIWAGYRFSFGPVFSKAAMTPSSEAKLKTVSARERHLLTATPVPADEFFRGLIMAKGTGSNGRESYLLGQVYSGGRWYFFPVAILVKTPLAMLFLLGTGIAFLLLRKHLRRDPEIAVLVLGAACPLLVGMAGSMNIGLRHVLPIYPFLAMLASVGAMELWRLRGERAKLIARTAVVLLLGWEFASCAAAGPDLISYFNVAAARHADYFLVNSDLDWGQDLSVLATTLHNDHATSVSIRYFGDPDINLSQLPNPTPLAPGHRVQGWVAISETTYKEEPDNYGWLAPYPYTPVGHSIRLYHLPPA